MGFPEPPNMDNQPPAGYPGQPPAGYPGQPPQGYPGQPPYGYAPAPAPQTTNGQSIAGFVLSFLIPPLGFIFSIVGLVVGGRRGQKGKGLAIAGIVISLVVGGVETAVVVAVAAAVGKNAATVFDPGCTQGKAVILNEAAKLSSDPDTLKTQLTSIVSKLKAAGAASNSDEVQKAMNTLATDYDDLLKALNTKSMPPADIEARVTKDATAIDELCTIGGAQQ
ncbi:hypothetical protein Pth03_55350 [Planotetraspora thailandica]|uniref:DUF4190 domain-containing protein n=1 Tax=Planotetraspora thailandica TaxID=487172 RepID=A0A8J3V5A0_9ACTN|nr:hypothetical protein [Planotetraspora thailandica]GII57146.1 hypothetical protein Pth03_55350 [Planotetraspora thailandica]